MTVQQWQLKLDFCHPGKLSHSESINRILESCSIAGCSVRALLKNVRAHAHNLTFILALSSSARMVCESLINSDTLEWERTQLWALTFKLVRKIIGGVDYKVFPPPIPFFVRRCIALWLCFYVFVLVNPLLLPRKSNSESLVWSDSNKRSRKPCISLRRRLLHKCWWVCQIKPIKHNIVCWAVCTRRHMLGISGCTSRFQQLFFFTWGMPRVRSPIRGLMPLVFTFSLALCLLALSKNHLISLKMLSGHIHYVIYLPEMKNILEH